MTKWFNEKGKKREKVISMCYKRYGGYLQLGSDPSLKK